MVRQMEQFGFTDGVSVAGGGTVQPPPIQLPVANGSTKGIATGDGTTITATNGSLSAKTATPTTKGIIGIDDDTLRLDSDGKLYAVKFRVVTVANDEPEYPEGITPKRRDIIYVGTIDSEELSPDFKRGGFYTYNTTVPSNPYWSLIGFMINTVAKKDKVDNIGNTANYSESIQGSGSGSEYAVGNGKSFPSLTQNKDMLVIASFNMSNAEVNEFELSGRITLEDAETHVARKEIPFTYITKGKGSISFSFYENWHVGEVIRPYINDIVNNQYNCTLKFIYFS